jgi:competence protein ComEA
MKQARKLIATALSAVLLGASLAAAAQEQAPRVDVNRATVQELETLPQVGPVLAQRIVEFREKHGPYKTVEDLIKVQGVGEKLLARLRDRVTVGGQKP